MSMSTEELIAELKLTAEIDEDLLDGIGDVGRLCLRTVGVLRSQQQRIAELEGENDRLCEVMNEMQGPTQMGEPVLPPKRLVDTLDLMRDEFRRIKALVFPDDEIAGICDRSVSGIEQTVSVVVQRDDAVREIIRLSAELEAEREKHRWVRVSDGLPEDGATVAFVVSTPRDPLDYLNGRVLGGRYVPGSFGGFTMPGLTLEATHWMPLPEPPKEPRP